MARSTNSQPTQGVPSPSRTSNKAGAGEVIAASSGDTVIITDILTSAATTISTAAAGAGTIIAYAPAGASNLNQAIAVLIKKKENSITFLITTMGMGQY